MESILFFLWSMFWTTIKCLFISIVITYVWMKICYRGLRLSFKNLALIFYKYENAGKKINLIVFPGVTFVFSLLPIFAETEKSAPFIFLIYCSAMTLELISQMKNSLAMYIKANKFEKK